MYFWYVKRKIKNCYLGFLKLYIIKYNFGLFKKKEIYLKFGVLKSNIRVLEIGRYGLRGRNVSSICSDFIGKELIFMFCFFCYFV